MSTKKDKVVKYYCNISDTVIEFNIYDNICEITNIYIDNDANILKLFVILLKKSINDLKLNYSCKYFRQIITLIEYNEYFDKMQLWREIESDDKYIELECDIDNAIDNILFGYGIKL